MAERLAAISSVSPSVSLGTTTTHTLGSVTITAEEMPIEAFAALIGELADIPVAVVGDGSKLVTATAVEEDAWTVLERAGRPHGLSPQLEAGVVYLVNDEDRTYSSYAFIPAGYSDPAEVITSIKSLIGERGSVEQLGGRVVVIGDEETIRQAEEFGRRIQSGIDGWLLELVVYQTTRNFERAVGAAVTGGVDLNLGAEVNDSDLSVVFGGQAALQLLAEYSETTDDVELVTTATTYLIEDRPATLTQGETVRIRSRAVSGEGTVTDTGFQTIDTGLRLSVLGTRVEDDLLLEVNATVSAITGVSGDLPTTSETTSQTVIVTQAGQWTVLSGLRTVGRVKGSGGLPGVPWLQSDIIRDQDQQLVLGIRATRVHGARKGD